MVGYEVLKAKKGPFSRLAFSGYKMVQNRLTRFWSIFITPQDNLNDSFGKCWAMSKVEFTLQWMLQKQKDIQIKGIQFWQLFHLSNVCWEINWIGIIPNFYMWENYPNSQLLVKAINMIHKILYMAIKVNSVSKFICLKCQQRASKSQIKRLICKEHFKHVKHKILIWKTYHCIINDNKHFNKFLFLICQPFVSFLFVIIRLYITTINLNMKYVCVSDKVL